MIAAVGFYEHTGDWMYTSGIPAKTGRIGVAPYADDIANTANSELTIIDCLHSFITYTSL